MKERKKNEWIKEREDINDFELILNLEMSNEISLRQL
jgi:hypothetical protein